ncbi:MAG: Holliday junction branch migration protein RuvA [Clostridia bacterium]|nr:Holliday junction branch migration protein RuvA [Clostridia bacterium]
MIAMIKGVLMEKGEGEAVIMTASGLGMRVMCSMNTLSALPMAGGECTLHTYMNVREDAMELFGFLKREEKDMFQRLISVSGVGPKIALAVLGSMPLSDLRLAILTGDAAALARAPGIGKKTAQRLSLELKDKLAQDALGGTVGMEDIAVTSAVDAPAQDAVSEAMLALKSLGYTPQEAANALKGVKGQGNTADELIRAALRHMAQNG